MWWFWFLVSFTNLLVGDGKKDLVGMGECVYLCGPLLGSGLVLKILVIKPERFFFCFVKGAEK